MLLFLQANYPHVHIQCKLIVHKVVVSTSSRFRKSWNGAAAILDLSFYNSTLFRHSTSGKRKN
jgi:hypothetical protein